MKEILTELKRRGVFTVVGGPLVTVQEDYFGDLADVIFIGESRGDLAPVPQRMEAGAAPGPV